MHKGIPALDALTALQATLRKKFKHETDITFTEENDLWRTAGSRTRTIRIAISAEEDVWTLKISIVALEGEAILAIALPKGGLAKTTLTLSTDNLLRKYPSLEVLRATPRILDDQRGVVSKDVETVVSAFAQVYHAP